MTAPQPKLTIEDEHHEPARVSAPAHRQVGPVVAIVFLLLVAGGLRLYQLGRASFWIDEIASIDVAAQSLTDLVRNYRPGHHPDRGAEQAPLAFIVMHIFLSADISESSARLPSALLGAASVLALFLLVRRFFEPRIAYVAALLLAISPLHVWFSQEARWYAQWLLLTILSYAALLRAWETGRLRAWAAYGVCTALNLYTFNLTALVIASQGMSVLWLQRRRETSRRFLPAFVLVQLAAAIAAAPVIWMVVKSLGLTTGTPRRPHLADLPYTFFVYAAGYSAGPTTEFLHGLPRVSAILAQYPIVILFGAVFAPLAVVGVRQLLRDGRAAILFLPWCFGPPLFAFVVSLLSNVTYQARYGSAALPAFLLLIALGGLSLRGRGQRATALTAVIACFAFSLGNYYWNPVYAKEDVKGAVAHIRAANGTPTILVVGQIADAANHYARGLQPTIVQHCAADATGDGALDVTLHRPLWLIVGRDWSREGQVCVDRIAGTHRTVEQVQFAGVSLWRFEPLSEPPHAHAALL